MPGIKPSNDNRPIGAGLPALLATDPADRIGPGALVLVVGPSGAGKDTLIRLAKTELRADPRVFFPRRIVTRSADETEDNLTVSDAEFADLIAAGSSPLWWYAHGLGYAVPGEIDEIIGDGGVVVVNVSRRIIPLALQRYARVTVVYVTAPRAVLAERLAARGRESTEAVAARLERAEDVLPPAPKLVVIQNVGEPRDNAARIVDLIHDLQATTRAEP